METKDPFFLSVNALIETGCSYIKKKKRKKKPLKNKPEEKWSVKLLNCLVLNCSLQSRDNDPSVRKPHNTLILAEEHLSQDVRHASASMVYACFAKFV